MKPGLGQLIIALLAGLLMPTNGSCADRWELIGELPDGTGGPGQPRNLGVGGGFTGVHNDALIIAGGSNFPVREGESLWSDRTTKKFYDQIWVATRVQPAETTAQGESHARGDQLLWHDVGLRLPSKRGYGASVSHNLGLFLIGGTDGVSSTGDSLLLRWDPASAQLQMFRLPPLPVPSIEGGAAIIGNVLYLLSGSDGKTETADLYAFDLKRIDKKQLEFNRSASLQDVPILPKRDSEGRDVSPWRKLASIPSPNGESMARSKSMVAAQSNGRVTRLYVIGGQRIVGPGEHPDAVPAGLGNDRTHILFYDDVWAFTPGRGAASGSWRRMADVEVGNDRGGRAAGTAMPIGSNQILLLTSAKGDLIRTAFGELKTGWAGFPNHPGFEPQSLVYNSRRDSWVAGPSVPFVPDPLDGNAHRVVAGAVTTQAVCAWGKIILPSGEVRPRVRTPQIWAVHTFSLKARCVEPR